MTRLLGWLVLLAAGMLSLPLAAYFLDDQGTENWILPVQLGGMALIGALVGVALPGFLTGSTRRRAIVGAAYGVGAAVAGAARATAASTAMAFRCADKRSDWRWTGPSKRRPSQARSSSIAATRSGRDRTGSMSSIRSSRRPAIRCANAAFSRAE